MLRFLTSQSLPRCPQTCGAAKERAFPTTVTQSLPPLLRNSQVHCFPPHKLPKEPASHLLLGVETWVLASVQNCDLSENGQEQVNGLCRFGAVTCLRRKSSRSGSGCRSCICSFLLCMFPPAPEGSDHPLPQKLACKGMSASCTWDSASRPSSPSLPLEDCMDVFLGSSLPEAQTTSPGTQNTSHADLFPFPGRFSLPAIHLLSQYLLKPENY